MSCSLLTPAPVTEDSFPLRHKVRTGLSHQGERAPGRADGTQDDAVSFPDDLQLAHPLKIKIAGQTDGTVIAVFKNRYGSHDFSPG